MHMYTYIPHFMYINTDASVFNNDGDKYTYSNDNFLNKEYLI